MIKGMNKAVAALIYNTIYDLTSDDGAWTVEDDRDDTSYLVFAEELIKAIESNPEMEDSQIIKLARESTDRSKDAPHGWDIIIIDQEYSSLCTQTGNLMPIIRNFIDEQPPIYSECEFLDDEE